MEKWIRTILTLPMGLMPALWGQTPLPSPEDMKPMGLVGGLSWHSTVDYYRLINQAVNDRYRNKTIQTRPCSCGISIRPASMNCRTGMSGMRSPGS